MGAGTSSGKATGAATDGASTGSALVGQRFSSKTLGLAFTQVESAIKAQGFRIVDKETDMNSPGVSYTGAYWITRNDNPDEDYMVDIKIERDRSVTIKQIRKT